MILGEIRGYLQNGKQGIKDLRFNQKELRNYIVSFRRKLGWSTRSELAKRMGVTLKHVSQLIKEHRLDKSKPKDVIFNPRAKKKITPYELLTTTPADLANCNDLSWKYIIKNGLIREISSYKEAALYSGAV